MNDDGVSTVVGTMLSIPIILMVFTLIMSIAVAEAQERIDDYIDNRTEDLEDLMDRYVGDDGLPDGVNTSVIIQAIDDGLAQFTYTNSTIYINIQAQNQTLSRYIK